MLQLRARTVLSLVDAAVTDNVVAEAVMMLSVLVRVVVVRPVVVRVVLARAVLAKVVAVKVVLARAVDVVDDEAVVADVAEAVQVALLPALLPASKSGNPRMSVRTCWFWDHVSKVVFQRGNSRSVFSRLTSAISGPM